MHVNTKLLNWRDACASLQATAHQRCTFGIPTDISRPTAFRLNGEHRRPFTQIRPKPYLVQDILGWNLTLIMQNAEEKTFAFGGPIPRQKNIIKIPIQKF